MMKQIDHLAFHADDLNKWQATLSLDQLGLKMQAIALACEQGDEDYLQQSPFIDRIVYSDGTWKKIIRGSGRLDY